jgi:hypothetical protein
MNLSDLKTSNFLRKEDVGVGCLVTISALTQENVAQQGAEPDMKTALHFSELDKPLVLNITNGQIIARITGFDDNIETNWIGTKIVLYHDPNVSYAGKLVGGIRVRAPKAGSVPDKVLPLKQPNPYPLAGRQPGEDSSLPF